MTLSEIHAEIDKLFEELKTKIKEWVGGGGTPPPPPTSPDVGGGGTPPPPGGGQ